MRSLPSSLLDLAVIASIATGCATDTVSGEAELPGGDCETSYLDYQTFGAPFVINWCRGCHSSDVPIAMRQNAPAEVNFDDLAMTLQFKDRILLRATGATPTMPPAGGPSAEERELLVEWLACGGR